MTPAFGSLDPTQRARPTGRAACWRSCSTRAPGPPAVDLASAATCILASPARRHVALRTAAPCQLQRVRLPVRHGTVVINVRALGGIERRTISF
jgi:hypothetical protein